MCSFFVMASAASVPPLTRHVTDTANIIPDDVEAAIEAKLTAFEAQTTNHIAIVTILALPSNETIETEAYKIFNES